MSLSFPKILVLAIILTFVSGLYVEHPPILDAETVLYGFPFPWLWVDRSTWNPPPDNPWKWNFYWPFLLLDLVVYGLIVAAVFYVKRRWLDRT